MTNSSLMAAALACETKVRLSLLWRCRKGEYLHGSIPAMAAAYLFHLCQNHAFLD